MRVVLQVDADAQRKPAQVFAEAIAVRAQPVTAGQHPHAAVVGGVGVVAYRGGTRIDVREAIHHQHLRDRRSAGGGGHERGEQARVAVGRRWRTGAGRRGAAGRRGRRGHRRILRRYGRGQHELAGIGAGRHLLEAVLPEAVGGGDRRGKYERVAGGGAARVHDEDAVDRLRAGAAGSLRDLEHGAAGGVAVNQQAIGRGIVAREYGAHQHAAGAGPVAVDVQDVARGVLAEVDGAVVRYGPVQRHGRRQYVRYMARHERAGGVDHQMRAVRFARAAEFGTVERTRVIDRHARAVQQFDALEAVDVDMLVAVGAAGRAAMVAAGARFERLAVEADHVDIAVAHAERVVARVGIAFEAVHMVERCARGDVHGVAAEAAAEFVQG